MKNWRANVAKVAARARPLTWPVVRQLAGVEIETDPLTESEQALWDKLRNGAEPRIVFKTFTRHDVGEWLKDGRICVAVAGGFLFQFAAGKRPFSAKCPVGELVDSAYNHITGEVVLDPAGSLKVRRLKMAPVHGNQLLETIHNEVMSHA
jgi:hypothetical protein